MFRSMLCALVVVVLAGCATSGTGVAPYTVRHTAAAPSLDAPWNDPQWEKAETLRIAHWLNGSVEGLVDSGHRPPTEARVLWDEKGLYVQWRVEDRYVRSIATEYRGKVWEDAAVEFFVAPVAGRGYFNFETNCSGTLLLSYHENKAYTGPSLRKAGGVPWELAQQVIIRPTMPPTVEPEIAEPVTWTLAYFIPFAIFEAYLGPFEDVTALDWRANFYKCAESNSHPHWGSWAPIKEGVNFHAPEWFAPLRFEE